MKTGVHVLLSKISSICPTGPLLVSLSSFLPQETDLYEILLQCKKGERRVLKPFPMRFSLAAVSSRKPCLHTSFLLGSATFSLPPDLQAQRWSHLLCYNPRVTNSTISGGSLTLLSVYETLFQLPSFGYASVLCWSPDSALRMWRLAVPGV